jgi:hypothetical protein
MNHNIFLSGNYDTHFWELYSSEFFKKDENEEELLTKIAAAVFASSKNTVVPKKVKGATKGCKKNQWKTVGKILL